ncbi:MAG: helicase domain-containing protein [Limisphaerales bacterium]|nr:MAG: helicase domain-containing protein [Limisphaerales bacterium]TXT49152.1 MAG: helicase domain-containing protein [Limisphaerales bacterium]
MAGRPVQGRFRFLLTGMSEPAKSGGELFIVDNSESDWKGLNYLQEWTDIASAFDIATGYFEIGSLLALDGRWQKLDRVRILMGDEASARTQKAIRDGLEAKISAALDSSLEREKEQNDFLTGVAAIVTAMKTGKIECRVFTKKKFHAKAYITHPRVKVIGSVALVGSSNFTVPGLTQNVELNIQIRAPGDVSQLQDWFERHWEQAEEVTPKVIEIIERQVREYSPFEVYAKALRELFTRHEMTANEWEQKDSRIFQELDQYQRDGYKGVYGIAGQHGGAFLCDGVGLGKTFIGLMLIDRLVNYDKKRVVLLVPKSGRESVWERNIRKYLPDVLNGFLPFKIYNHTDLMRGVSADEVDYPAIFAQLKQQADVILIDEAHHFRNRGLSRESGGSRYWQLYSLCEGKQVYLMTATPVNNHLTDFQHLIELFSRIERTNYFDTRLGIHSIPSHFQLLEKQLANIMRGEGLGELFQANAIEAEQVLFSDKLFRELVVQRSRAFVKQSQKQQGSSEALFPKKEDPRVADYSVKKTYGHLLGKVELAFSKDKPLFALAPYYPLAYFKGDPETIEGFEGGRQKGLVRLIRVGFLKRFESSIMAFEQSCQNLLLKLLAFIKVNSATEHELKRFGKWKILNSEVLEHVQARKQEFAEEDTAEEEEDELADEFAGHFTALERDNYKMDEVFDDTYGDMDTLVKFLEELRTFTPEHDDKLRALVKLLKSDPDLKGRKVLIFTEFMTTARYLKRELVKAGLDGVDEIDSGSKRDRAEALQQFSPYYNGVTSGWLAERGLKESRILIATDVLSEGLNLQDATRLINYDLHWNPVRLMQRIGRVDRRLSAEVEAKLLKDHPGEQQNRGRVIYWNFLPPDELDDLLKLFGRVAHKTLRISKVFGIEGRKLLKPDDDFDALKDFLSSYEGSTTPAEKMQLELERLLAADPKLAERLDRLPGRVFSGKHLPKPGTQAVFFCYTLPAEDQAKKEWTEAAGRAAWYLVSLADGKIRDQPEEIDAFIRCEPDTPRHCTMPPATLREIRLKVERHITSTYLKKVQAPVGVKPILRCWMELN